MSSFIHPTAVIEDNVEISANCSVWHFCHLREGVKLEEEVSLGRSVYCDPGITLKEGCRVQNGVSLYKGLVIEPWTFIGPHTVFTNDKNPRAGKSQWTPIKTHLQTGCSIGAGAIINTGIILGAFCLIGAGAIVLKDVPPFAIAKGNPLAISGYTCACGNSRFNEFKIENCLQKCCEENLIPRALKNAKSFIEKL